MILLVQDFGKWQSAGRVQQVLQNSKVMTDESTAQIAVWISNSLSLALINNITELYINLCTK